MLATSKKPYNPNYDPLAIDDINWNKSDLSSFLDNIHNVPINDITISGKDISFYQTAAKAEIAAELISTINLIHYKLLSAVKDVINYNNVLIKKTQKVNKKIDFCVKEIEDLAAQTQRNNLLLFKMAHNKPELQFDDFKINTKANDFDIINKPRIDTNIEEPIPTIIIGPIEQTIEQTKQIICASANSCPNIRDKTNIDSDHKLIINDPSDKKIKSCIEINVSEPIAQIIDGSSETNTALPSKSANPSAIMRGQIKILNEPQLQPQNTKIKPKNPSPKKIYKTQNKSKVKKKKKKIKNKNNIKRNNKKKRKQKKKKIILSYCDLEQIIRESHFTDDDYQDWMNIHFIDPEYSAAIHYEKTYGLSAINAIKQLHANDQ